jgi:hypothetical protein
MAVVILDVCPKCRVDVSRRFGLIRTPVIACPSCGYEMRVTENAVRNNWQYNIGVGAILIIWLILACLVLLDPKGASAFAVRFGKTKGIDNPWILAGMSFIPAALIGLPFALIGRIMGIGVARQMQSSFPREASEDGFPSSPFSSGPEAGRRGLKSDQWLPRSPATPAAGVHQVPPSGGGIPGFFLKAVAAVVWLVVFFVAGSITISTIVLSLTEGDHETRQKAVENAGKAGGVPLLFASIFLTITLAKLGWLPGFRRRKAASPGIDPALPPVAPPDSRVIMGR